jgi:putative endonuclease
MAFNKKQNKLTGNLCEDLATEYLMGKGYKIINRNINFSFGEIDILAEFNKTIIIVEVKTVKGRGFGLAQDLVRYAKQNKLRLLGSVIEQQYPGRAIRIDVVAIDLSSSQPGIEHLVNAVEG